MTPDRQTGEVLSWFPDRGFGFIAPDAGGRRVFFHATALERGTGLRAGVHVEYTTLADANRRRAVGVRVLVEA